MHSRDVELGCEFRLQRECHANRPATADADPFHSVRARPRKPLLADAGCQDNFDLRT